MTKKRLTFILFIIAVLQLIPFLAMQFTKEVNWSVADFVIMGILLFGTSLLYVFILGKVTKLQHRIILYILIAILFLLFWAELAVGIFGTPFAGI